MTVQELYESIGGSYDSAKRILPMDQLIAKFVVRFLDDKSFEKIEAAAPVHWAIIVYLALACTVAGYLLQNAALESLSSRLVALLQCVCPVMTALFSFLLLGERLSAAGLVGAAILLGCVAAETLMQEDRDP